MKYRGHLTERAKSRLLSQRLVRQLKDRRFLHKVSLCEPCEPLVCHIRWWHRSQSIANQVVSQRSTAERRTSTSVHIRREVIKEWSSLLDYGKCKTALEIYAPLKIAAGEQLFQCSFFNMESSWDTSALLLSLRKGCQALLYWGMFFFFFEYEFLEKHKWHYRQAQSQGHFMATKWKRKSAKQRGVWVDSNEEVICILTVLHWREPFYASKNSI